ncbi:MAG: hypothetical protein U1B77_00195 [Dehalococcoidales bacterium]|nr:hypothetical protein [Dehalococcoidales bacterium]
MVDIILTEADPVYWSGYGGGPQAATLTEENSAYFANGGGGPQAVALEETGPDYSAQGGGGLAEIGLTELPPLYPAPQVTTGPVTEMGLESGTLNGILDDDGGMDCECWFEWGLDTSYGHVTLPVSKATGEMFFYVLDGLPPDTVYHFRALASNVFGLSRGVDKTFKTSGSVLPPYFQGPLSLLLEEET